MDTVRLLKFTLLLHDIGKPACQSIDEKGGIHFHGHEATGAEAAIAICERLRCSVKERLFVTSMISRHSRPLQLYHLDQKGTLTERAITRLFMASENETPYLILHAGADMYGKGIAAADYAAFVSFLSRLFIKYISNYKIKKTAPPLLTGEDLISRFGLMPSPLFKEILEQIEETRLSENHMDREDAIALVERLLSGFDWSHDRTKA